MPLHKYKKEFVVARSLRQSKILDIISSYEIETQDELVSHLRALNFDVTQATISRDIKELGLIKIIGESKKYKYAYVDTYEQQASNKLVGIFKEVVISIRVVQNQVVLKTLKCLASTVSGFIDKLNYEEIIGTVYGDDTVLVITSNERLANEICKKLNNLL